jgi:hypothetical protein
VFGYLGLLLIWSFKLASVLIRILIVLAWSGSSCFEGIVREGILDYAFSLDSWQRWD